MDLTWLGHAAVRLRSGPTALIMDPYPESIGLRFPPQQRTAQVVTLSGDDASVSTAQVAAGEHSPTVINGPGEYEASGLRIRGIRNNRYAPEGEVAWNTAYTVEVEGLAVCHLGNPSRLLSSREIEDLGSPSVLFVGVGDVNGLSPADAVETVTSISPRIVVPILYAHAGDNTGLRELAPFLSELGAKASEAQSRFTVTKGNLPEETQVVLLEPAGTPA